MSSGSRCRRRITNSLESTPAHLLSTLMSPELPFYTRRRFLRSTLLGGAASVTVPAFLARTLDALDLQAAASAAAAGGMTDQPVLVVLQMAGGNDGLNTVVPFANDFYRKARPQLGLPAGNVLKINDTTGFHPALSQVKDLYDDGRLAVVQGVGYPNPNRSHFRSTEIWQTASDANKVARFGWIGRYFDHACKGTDPTIGVNVGRQTPQAFVGPRPLGVSLENPDQYRYAGADLPHDDETMGGDTFYRKLNQPAMEAPEDTPASGSTITSVPGSIQTSGSPLDFLDRTALDAQLSSDRILAISRRGRNSGDYPAGPLAHSLKLVARLIGGGLPTRVFYVSQGGYDTHTNQVPTQDRLLREMSGCLKAFLDDLREQGQAQRVLVMTFSEFGRRVAQNANGGTDHGAASVLFLAGATVQAGLLGTPPSLAPADLFNGDLRHTTDFRSVYASLLEQWLRVDSTQILGRRFAPLTLTRRTA